MQMAMYTTARRMKICGGRVLYKRQALSSHCDSWHYHHIKQHMEQAKQYSCLSVSLLRAAQNWYCKAQEVE